MHWVRRVGSLLAVVGVLGLGLVTACGSAEDDPAAGGPDDTGGEPVEANATGLPDDFVQAVLFSSGDELVALAPRGAADPTTTEAPSDDEGTSAPAPEIVAYRSSDAETWTEQGVVTGLDFGGDEFVTGGAGDPDTLLLVGGTFSGSGADGTPMALTSADGLDWRRVADDDLPEVTGLSAVTVDGAGAGFLAAGASSDREPVVLRTDDGASWSTAAVSGLEVVDGSEEVDAMATTGDAFVAFGLTECDDCSDDDVAVAWVSPDGADWATADLGPLADALDQPNSDLVPTVVGTPAGFVAIVAASDSGDPPGAWVSADGTQWREGPPLDVPDDAEYLGAAALGDEAVVLFAVDGAPALRLISATG